MKDISQLIQERNELLKSHIAGQFIKADKPDGHWVTSEETGKHIFIGADGQPKYTREQIEGGSGSLGGVADEPSDDKKESLEDLKLQHIKLTNQALKTFPNSQKQLEVRKQRDEVGNKIKELENKDNKETKTESKTEDKSSDSFEKKHGVSLDKLVNQANENNEDIYDTYEKLTDKRIYVDDEGNKFTNDLLNELNEKGLKLKKKIQAQGVEIKSIPTPPPKYNKEGLDSLFDRVTSREKNRIFMSGVHVEGDKIVATDAHKLIILKHNDSELAKMDGKTININKKEIINPDKKDKYNQVYPDYKAIIPQNNPYKADETIDNLLSIANGAVNSFKNIKDTPEAIPFKIGGSDTIFMNPNILLDTLKVLKGNGANKVKVSASVPNRAILFETDNGNLALAMPVMNYEGGTATTQEFKLGKD